MSPRWRTRLRPLLSLWLCLNLLGGPGGAASPLLTVAAQETKPTLGRLVGLAGLVGAAVAANLAGPRPAAQAQSLPPSQLLVGTNGAGLLAYGSGGWSQRNGGHDLLDVQRVLSPRGLPGVVYLVGTTGASGTGLHKVYRSTDAGQSWSQLPDTPSSTNDVQVTPHEDVLYARVGGTTEPTSGLYRSADGGQSWTRIVGPYTPTSGFGAGSPQGVTSFGLGPNRRLFFAQLRDDNDQLRFTDDEASTTTSLGDGLLFGDRLLYPSLRPDRLYFETGTGLLSRVELEGGVVTSSGVGTGDIEYALAAGQSDFALAWGLTFGTTTYHLWRSTTGGASWTAVLDPGRLPVNPGILQDPQEPSTWWLLGSGDAVWSSTDHGLNWTAQPTGYADNRSAALVGAALLPLAPIVATENSPPLIHGSKSADPVHTLTGAYLYGHTDLALPGRGPSPIFQRSYHSGDPRIGPLGPGWTHRYGSHLEDPTDGSGDVVLVGPQGRSDRYTRQPNGSYSPPPGLVTSLVQETDRSYTVTHPDQSVWRFRADGRLSSLADRHGNQSSLTYSSSGQLLTVSDPAGRGALSFSYTSSGRLASLTDWASPPRTVTFQYDPAGRLWKVIDRESQTTTYGYVGSSVRLATLTDANGHVAVTNSYDSQGRVSTQKDAKGLTSGQQTSFSYATNPDGTRTTTVSYPTTSADPTWQPQQIDTYDSQGRISQQRWKPTASSADDRVTSLSYDAQSRLSAVTDGRGQTTNFCYDVEPNGNPLPGSAGNLTRRLDPPPSGGASRPVSLFSYDAKRNLTRVISPKGVASGSGVSCTTDLSASLDLRYATDYGYDASQTKLLSSTAQATDPELGQRSLVTKFEYTDSGNPGRVTRLIPPRGNSGPSPDSSYATSLSYFGTGSKAGLLQSTTDPLGRISSFDYDPVGRQTSAVDPNGQTWTTSYDREDRVLTAQAPAPTVGDSPLQTTFQYDPVGNRTVVIDPSGQVSRYRYDERDSLQEVQQSPSAWTNPNDTPSPLLRTEYQYDQLGNLSRVTRAVGDANHERVTDYTHDGLNRPLRETQYPSWPSTSPSLVTQFGYDPNGNRTSQTDPLGQTTSFSYDGLNRLTALDYSDPSTPDVSYSYDADGNRTTLSDGIGTTSYSYDEPGRLLSVTSPGPRTIGYRYDRDGQRVKLLYPDGKTVSSTIDQGGQLTSLQDWVGRTTSYQYFPDGKLKQVTGVNGTQASFSYDRAQRLTEVRHQTSAQVTLSQHTYTLDRLGNRTRLDEVLGGPAPPPSGTPAPLPASRALPTVAATPAAMPSGRNLPTVAATPAALPSRPTAPSGTSQSWTYSYDRLSRLLSATGPTTSTTYAYDPVGNRLTMTRGTNTAYSYDRADRLTAAGPTGYTVNANGNTTTRGGDNFSYDQANRLVQATVNGTTSTSTWDGDGKRASATSGGATTSYLYDVNGGLPVLLEDSSRKYVWGLGLAYAVDTSGKVEVYHTDGLGSVRALTDASQSVIVRYETDEFGVPISTTGSSGQPFGYTGEQRDSQTGLVYLRARLYEPGVGRFLQRDPWDPVSCARDDPTRLHRFAYTENNPVNRVDPSGHASNLVLGTRYTGLDESNDGPTICLPLPAWSPAAGLSTFTICFDFTQARNWECTATGYWYHIAEGTYSGPYTATARGRDRVATCAAAEFNFRNATPPGVRSRHVRCDPERDCRRVR